MPRLNDVNMEQVNLTGSYGYSAVGLDKLGSTEYTLITMACDASGSVAPFVAELEMALQTIIRSCKGSREENLLMRLLTFNDRVEEVHGFKLMETCDPQSYHNILNCGGMTALFDATENAISSTLDFGRKLMAPGMDYSINACVYILTDGENNRGGVNPADIKRMLSTAVSSEAVESIVTLLIGLNNTKILDALLSKFKEDAGLTHYEGIGTITESSLRRLTGLVSKSISQQSKSLAGAGSQPLNF